MSVSEPESLLYAGGNDFDDAKDGKPTEGVGMGTWGRVLLPEGVGGGTGLGTWGRVLFPEGVGGLCVMSRGGRFTVGSTCTSLSVVGTMPLLGCLLAERVVRPVSSLCCINIVR